MLTPIAIDDLITAIQDNDYQTYINPESRYQLAGEGTIESSRLKRLATQLQELASQDIFIRINSVSLGQELVKQPRLAARNLQQSLDKKDWNLDAVMKGLKLLYSTYPEVSELPAIELEKEVLALLVQRFQRITKHTELSLKLNGARLFASQLLTLEILLRSRTNPNLSDEVKEKFYQAWYLLAGLLPTPKQLREAADQCAYSMRADEFARAMQQLPQVLDALLERPVEPESGREMEKIEQHPNFLLLSAADSHTGWTEPSTFFQWHSETEMYRETPMSEGQSAATNLPFPSVTTQYFQDAQDFQENAELEKEALLHQAHQASGPEPSILTQRGSGVDIYRATPVSESQNTATNLPFHSATMQYFQDVQGFLGKARVEKEALLQEANRAVSLAFYQRFGAGVLPEKLAVIPVSVLQAHTRKAAQQLDSLWREFGEAPKEDAAWHNVKDLVALFSRAASGNRGELEVLRLYWEWLTDAHEMALQGQVLEEVQGGRDVLAWAGELSLEVGMWVLAQPQHAELVSRLIDPDAVQEVPEVSLRLVLNYLIWYHEPDSIRCFLQGLSGPEQEALKRQMQECGHAWLVGLTELWNGQGKFAALLNYVYSDKEAHKQIVSLNNHTLIQWIFEWISPKNQQMLEEIWNSLGNKEREFLDDLMYQYVIAQAQESGGQPLPEEFSLLDGPWEIRRVLSNPSKIQALFDVGHPEVAFRILKFAFQAEDSTITSDCLAAFFQAYKIADLNTQKVLKNIFVQQNYALFNDFIQYARKAALRRNSVFQQLVDPRLEFHAVHDGLVAKVKQEHRHVNLVHYSILTPIFEHVFQERAERFILFQSLYPATLFSTLFHLPLEYSAAPDFIEELKENVKALNRTTRLDIKTYLFGSNLTLREHRYDNLLMIAHKQPQLAGYLVDEFLTEGFNEECKTIINYTKPRNEVAAVYQMLLCSTKATSLMETELVKELALIQNLWNSAGRVFQKTLQHYLRQDEYDVMVRIAESRLNPQVVEWIVLNVFTDRDDRSSLWQIPCSRAVILKRDNFNYFVTNQHTYTIDHLKTELLPPFIVGRLEGSRERDLDTQFADILSLLRLQITGDKIAQVLAELVPIEHLVRCLPLNYKRTEIFKRLTAQPAYNDEHKQLALFQEIVNHSGCYTSFRMPYDTEILEMMVSSPNSQTRSLTALHLLLLQAKFESEARRQRLDINAKVQFTFWRGRSDGKNEYQLSNIQAIQKEYVKIAYDNHDDEFVQKLRQSHRDLLTIERFNAQLTNVPNPTPEEELDAKLQPGSFLNSICG